MTIMPEFEQELCNGCGLCVAACPGGGIIKVNDKVAIIEIETCDYCGVCEAVCPRYAIRCVYYIIAG